MGISEPLPASAPLPKSEHRGRFEGLWGREVEGWMIESDSGGGVKYMKNIEKLKRIKMI